MSPVLRSCVALVLLGAIVSGATTSEDYQSQGLRAIVRVYDECSKAETGFSPCLKKRAITFIDRLSRVDALTLGEMKIVRNERAVEPSKPLTEAELEQSLPRGLEARDEALTNMLLEKVAGIFSSRTVQVTLPKLSSEELGRGLEEGRGKMKKMMSMMIMGFMMKMAAMVPVAIAGLYLLAGKALIVSKIALLLAGIIGLKKLVASKQQHGSGWSSGGSGHGGWDRRSADAAAVAQNMAYSAYAKNQA
ncbi:AGAP013195-PA-like protein [Anopheles sinensis]|uniref:AGAP013195-PA-like protein n=1 Tax=Anopheles sinensis TaxID=74873 RepID=A0A084VLA2_ANOSI|nr:AGAP013195-PA-like protein [Anopheles sinensis]